jgi:hypothetical protein
VASTDGALDAPDYIPGGAMRGFNGCISGKPLTEVVLVFREGSILW